MPIIPYPTPKERVERFMNLNAGKPDMAAALEKVIIDVEITELRRLRSQICSKCAKVLNK